eukprot:72225-Pelagomonas_calceolata.AAC.3
MQKARQAAHTRTRRLRVRRRSMLGVCCRSSRAEVHLSRPRELITPRVRACMHSMHSTTQRMSSVKCYKQFVDPGKI